MKSVNAFIDEAEGPKKVEIVRTTVSMPKSMLIAMEDLAFQNKRKKHKLNSVSALVRVALQKEYKVT